MVINMGRIEKKVKLCGKNKCKELTGLFDTGSDKTTISPELAEELGVHFTNFEWETEIPTGEIVITKEAELGEIEILGSKRPSPRVSVFPGLGKDCIIGNDLMQELGIVLDPEKHIAKIDKSKTHILLY